MTFVLRVLVISVTAALRALGAAAPPASAWSPTTKTWNVGGCQFQGTSTTTQNPYESYASTTEKTYAVCGSPGVRFRTASGSYSAWRNGGSYHSVFASASKPHRYIGAAHRSCSTCRQLLT